MDKHFNLGKGKVMDAANKCIRCGMPVPIILSSSGMAYANCGHVNIENNVRCGFQMKFGRADSDQFQRDFLEGKKPANINSKPTGKPSNENPIAPTGESAGRGADGRTSELEQPADGKPAENDWKSRFE